MTRKYDELTDHVFVMENMHSRFLEMALRESGTRDRLPGLLRFPLKRVAAVAACVTAVAFAALVFPREAPGPEHPTVVPA